MVDRVPAYPGRVRLTPVSGQTNVYDLEMADSPSVVGTPLNKASLLTDETAAAIAALVGTTPATVNEAFNALATGGISRIASGSYTGTGTYGSANPTSLTLSFAPKLIIIGRAINTGMGVLVCNNAYGYSINENYNSGVIQRLALTVSGNAVSWYHTSNDEAQLNGTSGTYNYVALG